MKTLVYVLLTLTILTLEALLDRAYISLCIGFIGGAFWIMVVDKWGEASVLLITGVMILLATAAGAMAEALKDVLVPALKGARENVA